MIDDEIIELTEDDLTKEELEELFHTGKEDKPAKTYNAMVRFTATGNNWQ